MEQFTELAHKYMYLYLCRGTYTKVLVLVNCYILLFPILHMRGKFDKIAIDSLFLIIDIEEEEE